MLRCLYGRNIRALATGESGRLEPSLPARLPMGLPRYQHGVQRQSRRRQEDFRCSSREPASRADTIPPPSGVSREVPDRHPSAEDSAPAIDPNREEQQEHCPHCEPKQHPHRHCHRRPPRTDLRHNVRSHRRAPGSSYARQRVRARLRGLRCHTAPRTPARTSASRRAFISVYAVSISFLRALASTSRSGLSFT